MQDLLLDPPAASLRPHRMPERDITIAAEPARTVTTPLGTVAYRMTGTGSPLLLIMGFGGTMSTWDARFVGALAERYRVVTFNNAGIGGTSPLAEPLSVRAMADQTSALVTALGLGRVDVLGWSMGSTIASALAVLHPEQVRGLVLAAGWPGDGSTARPSHQAIDEFFANSAKTATVPSPTGAASYPPGPLVPSAVMSAQAKALIRWWAGRDPAGRRQSSITAPTLVVGGTADSLVPVANTRTISWLINRARLVLYPEAGHEFPFQCRTSFVPLVQSFLAGCGH